jgi:hypothetical protein
MTKIDTTRLRDYTMSNTYPLTKEQLLAQSRQRGADGEIVALINELPNISYASQEEVVRAVREVETRYQTDVWRTQGANTLPGTRTNQEGAATRRDTVDTVSEGSFPASDPPPWTAG